MIQFVKGEGELSLDCPNFNCNPPQAFFALVDVDDDGTVDYDEFMTMVEHMMELAMAG